MARALIWAESALKSLEEAADYIASDSPSYAASLLARAERAAASLLEMPERGRVVPEYEDPEVREIFVSSYRLIYRVRKDLVEIVGFVHGARDLARILARERGE